jgi:hypothetical protein
MSMVMSSDADRGGPAPTLFDGWAVGGILVLLTLWSLDFPHQLISTVIGSHFPWPAERFLKWPALLVERTLIEALVCIPAAAFLGLRLRRAGVYVAVFLATVFCFRVGSQLPAYVDMSREWRFLIFIAGIHILMLVGATSAFAHRKTQPLPQS